VLHVTLNKECRMFFNRHAVEALGEPDGVALLFDKRRKIIGVMPAALNKQHSYRLQPQWRGSKSKKIAAGNFCRKFGVKPTETIAFPNAEVNRDGILVLDLQQVKRVTRDK
jgi:hypothetical protein